MLETFMKICRERPNLVFSGQNIWYTLCEKLITFHFWRRDEILYDNTSVQQSIFFTLILRV